MLESDREIDGWYPEWARRLSEPQWTPVSVARRAAELLVGDRPAHILDVGSGAGKFCLIGALTTRGTFHGIEQRRSQVELAREAAQHAGATRATFQHGDLSDVDWGRFDGFYFFNPFHEHLTAGPDPLQEPIARSRALFDRHLTLTRAKLLDARLGTRVVTYCGWGSAFPAGYCMTLREPAASDYLELWQRVDSDGQDAR